MPGKISLFVPGPTNMPDRVRQAMDISNEDHRAPGMDKFWHPLLDDLKKVFETTSGQPCLLYTSPSPRDRQKSRMPSSA